MIDFYDFGVIKIKGKTYTNDVIINRDKVIENWWRREGHRIVLEDLFKYGIESNDYDYVLIGTGYYGMVVVDKTVLDFFKDSKILIDKTQKIVEEYNNLIKETRNILAMFHLTC